MVTVPEAVQKAVVFAKGILEAGRVEDLRLEEVEEVARSSVESERPSELIGYATAAPFAIGFLETAFAIEDNNMGIWR